MPEPTTPPPACTCSPPPTTPSGHRMNCPDWAEGGEVAEAAAPQTTTPARSPGIGGIGVGMPAALHLDAFGREINDAFGWFPMLVGSAAVSKVWRDVDVRLILPDDEFAALFPPLQPGTPADGRWDLLCAAISELARARTGLPVDFQIQSMTYANARFPGVRHALGLHDRNGQ